MPKWVGSFTEIWRFWQTWFFAVTTTIPAVAQLWLTMTRKLPAHEIIFYVGGTLVFFGLLAVLMIHIAALAGTKLGEGRKAMETARRLQGMHETGHGPAELQRIIQLWTGIQDPRHSEVERVDWQIALRQFKRCAELGHFTFANDANDTVHPGAHLGSRCDLPTTAHFFRRLAWRGMDRMMRGP